VNALSRVLGTSSLPASTIDRVSLETWHVDGAYLKVLY
jgi:hypothetical protein